MFIEIMMFIYSVGIRKLVFYLNLNGWKGMNVRYRLRLVRYCRGRVFSGFLWMFFCMIELLVMLVSVSSV